MRSALIVACTLLAALALGLAVPHLGFPLTGALVLLAGAGAVLAWPKRYSREDDRWWWYFYERYLRSPRWKRLRWRVCSRDRYKCWGCGHFDTPWRLQVHHERYHGWAWYALRLPERKRNLVTLCRPCHEREHSKGE